MNTSVPRNSDSNASEYLPPILPTSKILQQKRQEMLNNRARSEKERNERNIPSGRSVRKNSSVNMRKSMLPPINNEYDADTFYIRRDTDFPRGDESTFARTVAEGDIQSLSNLHSYDKSGIYQPDYVSTSRPISFHELDSVDNTWIRVFGYVPEDTSRVMQELQRCGYIADSRTTIANYMYIRYNTQLEVERALALNGTRINGNFIGVVRCTWEEVKENQESNINKIMSSTMDTRDYVVHENEIYKRAPVKRLSFCTWISEWLFGL